MKNQSEITEQAQNIETQFLDIHPRAIDVRIKISVLWVAAMFCYLYADVLKFLVPGIVEEIIAGEVGGIQINQSFLLGSAIFMIPPIVMIFLSLILKAKINRRANIIVGIFYTLVALMLVYGAIGASASGYLVYGSVEAVLTALIVWYAWKWSI